MGLRRAEGAPGSSMRAKWLQLDAAFDATPRGFPAVPHPLLIVGEPMGDGTGGERDFGVGFIDGGGMEPFDRDGRIVVVAEQVLELGEPAGGLVGGRSDDRCDCFVRIAGLLGAFPNFVQVGVGW